ncbi:hypothetical protein SK069_10005 [Patulibacter brassicae]|uniref:NlpC/P60 family protein n=1 Tax=Patulibacter brassicae TaxID=1705717 RepID=A0ABU4VMA5_9ACTN|nr:hypothetical protein [Patulibacter brassicae]MDX8151925.1 hypothetical protein [Patulibacter brassicae]
MRLRRLLLALLLVPALATPATAAAQRPWSGWDGGRQVAPGTEDEATDPGVDDGWSVEDDGPADDGTWTDDDGVVEDDLPADDDVADDEQPTAGWNGGDVLVPVPSSRRTIKGKVARIRTDGKAAIPRSAPTSVKRVIAAANLIVGKPYKWGGGHARLKDSGYDCSGAVGYAMIRAGLMTTTATSGQMARWGRAGGGRWITVHASQGHVYLEVAGLRLDTSRVGDPRGRSGVRWRPVIGRRKGFHSRHVAGL